MEQAIIIKRFLLDIEVIYKPEKTGGEEEGEIQATRHFNHSGMLE